MSSPAISGQTDSASATSDTLAPPAETVRACADRERRLTEYIRAHTGEDIAVCLTPHVPTACVMPASEGSLLESDNAEFSDEQAEQLVRSVDADYLVLISTQPATIDNLPISDQLTADRAQQFGYALHELGHIRYTAIADAATLLEEQVDEAYQEFVHGLWNGCEDAAIENQLAIDQSQLAADRLELVNRSISPHADAVPADDCYEHTFRDAVEKALYDTGIYDTGIRDALCDPDDDRFVFVSDADQKAFEQVTDSIDELVTTILSTPNSVDRAEHVLDWWETTIKPLLDSSEQQQQQPKQPDPAGATGESSADGRSSSRNNTGSSDGCGTDQSTDESADAERSSSENEAAQNGEDTADGGNPVDKPDGHGHDTSATTDEMGKRGETDGSVDSQSGTRPDPDAINTDQQQSSPGTDALDYPDIGGDEDATALQQPSSNSEAESESESEGKSESEDKDEREGETEPQSSIDPVGNEQTADGDSATESVSNTDTSADTSTEMGTESVDGSGSSDESLNRDNADSSARSDTDGRSVGEHNSDDTANGNDDTSPRAEASLDGEKQSGQKTGGSENRGDGNGTDEATENPEQGSEGGADGPPGESHSQQNPWRADDTTDQSTLGSFSAAETSPGENAVNASDISRSGESDETPTISPDSERNDPSTDVGDVGEPESESELKLEAGESDTKDGSKDITPTDTDRSENTTHEEEDANDNRPSGGGGNDTNTNAAREQRGGTPDESHTESEKQIAVPTSVHEGRDDGLDREGAFDTDRDAAHDEADRATPNEQALEHELADVADALDALADQDGGGAAPGSLSELTIMPDVGGSSTATTVGRWDEAATDAEFVADTLRKALKESRRDAHRSGVTSGTFDRQRAGALARGDVGAFHVRQPGDDKQYDLVMVLDRSGSMRRHIQTAEDALVRFALACEDIGINVGVIDFIDDEARLVKPFSVECEYVRTSLLSKQYGGNTPLADALGLGRELLEQRRNSPLVLVVTDGKPGDEDAYHDELQQSYAPVCGLTLVLDQPTGSVPNKVARNERFYDRHVYVHEPRQLTDRLDQFAVMFDGL